ncbi:MAG: hypothetical protein AAF633_23585 [Chloroflexota bacterium]
MTQENTLAAYLKSCETPDAVEVVKNELKSAAKPLRLIGYALLRLDENGVEPDRRSRGQHNFREKGGHAFCRLEPRR